MKKQVYPIGTKREVHANNSICVEVMTANGWLVIDVKPANPLVKKGIYYLKNH